MTVPDSVTFPKTGIIIMVPKAIGENLLRSFLLLSWCLGHSMDKW